MSIATMRNIRWSSPPGTSATDKVENIAWLREADESGSTITFTLHVLLKHQPVHNFLDNQQLGKSANTTSICDWLAIGIVQSVTTGPSPSESSFKGGSPADDDMVKTIEWMASGATAFGLLSAKFHTGGKAQQIL
jgi:hypothetical protein